MSVAKVIAAAEDYGHAYAELQASEAEYAAMEITLYDAVGRRESAIVNEKTTKAALLEAARAM